MRRAAAELVGTALLLAVVVGSGIMGDRLSSGNVAIALLANTLATGAGLFVLITAFADISGAHFNPVVTLVELINRRMNAAGSAMYVVAQFIGAYLGILLAHAMFGLALFQEATHVRSGFSFVLSEGVATFGLLITIALVSKSRPTMTPLAVSCFIVAGYWFTGSSAFANPAVTFSRAFTDTFAGIRMADVPGFMAGQLFGVISALIFTHLIIPADQRPGPNKN